MTERLTQEQLEAIHKRAEAATEGPWRDNFGSFVVGIEVWSDGGCVLSTEGGIVRYSDADFIAKAREDIPALLAEVERLQGREKRAEALIMEVRSELVDERLAETDIFTAVDEYLYGGDVE